MRPIIYVLGFGIISAMIIAACYPFGLDVIGHSSASAINNSSTTNASYIEASGAPTNTTDQDGNGKEGFSSVYAFCFIRARKCSINENLGRNHIEMEIALFSTFSFVFNFRTKTFRLSVAGTVLIGLFVDVPLKL